MSQLSYGNYENTLAHKEQQARQNARDNFQSYMACHRPLQLLSIEYKPDGDTPHWVGQVMVVSLLVDDLPIKLWKEDIDFINRVTGLEISTAPMNLEDKIINIMTAHCNKDGLNRATTVYSAEEGQYIYKNTPITNGASETNGVSETNEASEKSLQVSKSVKPEHRGYLHLRDLLRKDGIVNVNHDDPRIPKLRRLETLGYVKAPQHSTGIWTATDKIKAAPVANPVEPLPELEYGGFCILPRKSP